MPSHGEMNSDTGEMKLRASDGTLLFSYRGAYDDCIEKFHMFDRAIRKAEKIARESERRRMIDYLAAYVDA